MDTKYLGLGTNLKEYLFQEFTKNEEALYVFETFCYRQNCCERGKAGCIILQFVEREVEKKIGGVELLRYYRHCL